jgi:hypothetical protein
MALMMATTSMQGIGLITCSQRDCLCCCDCDSHNYFWDSDLLDSQQDSWDSQKVDYLGKAGGQDVSYSLDQHLSRNSIRVLIPRFLRIIGGGACCCLNELYLTVASILLTSPVLL